MEQAAQVKKQFAGTALKNDKFHLQKKFCSHGPGPGYIHHPHPAW